MTDGAARDGIEVEALLTDQYLDSLLAARDRRAIDVPADPRLDPVIRLTARRLDTDLARVHPSFRFEERLAAEIARRATLMRSGGGASGLPMMPMAASDGAPGSGSAARGAGGSAMPIAASSAAAQAAATARGAGGSAMPIAASSAAIQAATAAAARGAAPSAMPMTASNAAAQAARVGSESLLMPIAASTADVRATRPRTWRRPQLQVRAEGDPITLPHLDRSMPRPLLIGGALTSAAISIAGAWVAWRRGRPPVAPMARAVRAAHRTGAARGLGLPLDRARRVGARRLASR